MTAANSSLTLLNTQLGQLQALLNLLKQEKEVLQQHNPEDLNTLTEQKQQLLSDIETFDQNLSTNAQFIQDKQQGFIEQELASIQQCLTECQELNEINGQIIIHSQLAVERMKTTLLERHNNASITYNNKGKKSGGLSSLGIKA